MQMKYGALPILAAAAKVCRNSGSAVRSSLGVQGSNEEAACSAAASRRVDGTRDVGFFPPSSVKQLGYGRVFGGRVDDGSFGRNGYSALLGTKGTDYMVGASFVRLLGYPLVREETPRRGLQMPCAFERKQDPYVALRVLECLVS